VRSVEAGVGCAAALPGIYFIDANNAVVDMLQGEVKTEQVAAMLERR